MVGSAQLGRAGPGPSWPAAGGAQAARIAVAKAVQVG
jgi:hypothetical protein